MLSVLPEH